MFRLSTNRTKLIVIAGAVAALTVAGPSTADAASDLQNAATTAPAAGAGYPGPGVETWLGKRFPPPAPPRRNLSASQGGNGGTPSAPTGQSDSRRSSYETITNVR